MNREETIVRITDLLARRHDLFIESAHADADGIMRVIERAGYRLIPKLKVLSDEGMRQVIKRNINLFDFPDKALELLFEVAEAQLEADQKQLDNLNNKV